MFRAIFGWATMALFGAVSEKDRNLLTAVVAAAAIWPVMLFGALLPRTGAFLLAFVPIPKSAPTGLVRGDLDRADALWFPSRSDGSCAAAQPPPIPRSGRPCAIG